MSMSRTATKWLVLGCAGVFLAGCDRGPATVRVTGTVTAGGKPVPNLVVHFVPGGDRPSWGVTDDKGAFSLVYDRKTSGVVRGQHRVYVEFRPRDPKDDMAYQQGKMKLSPRLQKVLAKYGSLETSPLKVEISHNNQAVELDLK